MNDKERIAELEKALEKSTSCLKSLLYMPEQVRWYWDVDNVRHAPSWLTTRIAENEKMLES